MYNPLFYNLPKISPDLNDVLLLRREFAQPPIENQRIDSQFVFYEVTFKTLNQLFNSSSTSSPATSSKLGGVILPTTSNLTLDNSGNLSLTLSNINNVIGSTTPFNFVPGISIPSNKAINFDGGKTISVDNTTNNFTFNSGIATKSIKNAVFNVDVTGGVIGKNFQNYNNIAPINGVMGYTQATNSINNVFGYFGGYLYGHALRDITGNISPFTIYIGGDDMDTSDPNVIDPITNKPTVYGSTALNVIQAASNGNPNGGSRNAILGVVTVTGPTTGGWGYSALTGIATCNYNIGGVAGTLVSGTNSNIDILYKGAIYGGGPNVTLSNGATFIRQFSAWELDIFSDAGSSAAERFGMNIFLGDNIKNRGTVSDAGIVYGAGTSGTGWGYGIQFGNSTTFWPFTTDSILIGAVPRSHGPVDSYGLKAKIGIDFGAIIFTTNAFVSPGFSVDGSGNIKANSINTTGGSIALAGGSAQNNVIVSVYHTLVNSCPANGGITLSANIKIQKITNRSGVSINVWPVSGSSIETNAVNVPFVVPQYFSTIFENINGYTVAT